MVAEGEISGVAELWFDTQEDFAAALGSQAGHAALADAQSMVSNLELLHVVEHEFLPER